MAGKRSPRRALVTGGAGFIGSHLVDRLVAEGWSVRVLDDLSSGREDNLRGPAGLEEGSAGRRDDPRGSAGSAAAGHGSGACAPGPGAPLWSPAGGAAGRGSGGRVELLRGDVRDAALLERAVEGVEVVFHLAAVASVPRSVADPLETDAVNAGGTVRVLECARRAGARRVVYSASSAAYGESEEIPKVETLPAQPASPYALQKYAGEVYCRLFTELYGLETVALRYFNVYGPRQDPQSEYAAVIPRFVEACLAGRPPRIFGDGGQTRDFVFVSDAVEANLRAAAAPAAAGRTVNVASGKQTSLNELAELVTDLCGSSAVPVHEAPRPGDIRHSVADLQLARDLLGYAPAVDLREGLRQTIDAFARGRR